MKTTAYLQLIPQYNSYGKVTSLGTQLRKNPPREGIVGGFTLKINIEVPDKLLTPLPVNLIIPEDILDNNPIRVDVDNQEAER